MLWVDIRKPRVSLLGATDASEEGCGGTYARAESARVQEVGRLHVRRAITFILTATVTI